MKALTTPKIRIAIRKSPQSVGPSRSKAKSAKRIYVKRNKNIWSKEEDTRLLELIETYGPSHWSVIAEKLPGRQGKQCRERWRNHLSPDINKNSWGEAEEWRLFLLHQLLGNSWATLSKLLDNRTDNCIKNHWNSIMRRKTKQFEARLRSVLDENRLTEIANPDERNLIFRIRDGSRSVCPGKQGRKRNQDKFAEEQLLRELRVTSSNRAPSLEEFGQAPEESGGPRELVGISSNSPVTSNFRLFCDKEEGKASPPQSRPAKEVHPPSQIDTQSNAKEFPRANQPSFPNFSAFLQNIPSIGNLNFLGEDRPFTNLFSENEFGKSRANLALVQSPVVNFLETSNGKPLKENFFDNRLFISSMKSFQRFRD